MLLVVTTPRGALVDVEVDEVTAPGALGEFGILPGHVPFLSAVRPGVLVYRGKTHSGTLAVGDGYLQVAVAAGGAGASGERVLVLVDQAAAAADLDRAAAEREVVELDAEIDKWKRELDGEYRALLTRRAWAQARADAAGRAAAH